MILPFSTKFKSGEPTYFVEKIWESLAILNSFDSGAYQECKKNYPITCDRSFKPKRHSLRNDVHNRWRVGMKIHAVVFNRSKNQFQFIPTIECKSVQAIEIIRTSDYMNETIVKVDGRELIQDEVQRLAWNDGFDNLVSFWLYFSEGFKGKIIHWTNLKY